MVNLIVWYKGRENKVLYLKGHDTSGNYNFLQRFYFQVFISEKNFLKLDFS